jgi:hypothetical protein
MRVVTADPDFGPGAPAVVGVRDDGTFHVP